jgi:hypothetical protein
MNTGCWYSSAMCRLNAWASWSRLSKIQNSFLSKALTSLSLATFVLANFAEPLSHIGVSLWSMKMLFIGSTIFLVGYVVVVISMPSEFQGECNPDRIVDRMRKIEDHEFFRSRLELAKSLHNRLANSKHAELIKGPVGYVDQQIKEASTANKENRRELAGSLYHSDLVLRQYDIARARLTAVALLFLGVACLLLPAIMSVIRVILELISFS